MDIKDKIWELCEKYATDHEEDKRFGTIILGANTAGNNGVDPDDALGYADWHASSEVIIVLTELLDFIDKSNKGAK